MHALACSMHCIIRGVRASIGFQVLRRCVGTFDLTFDSGRRCRAAVYTCFFVMLAGARSSPVHAM